LYLFFRIPIIDYQFQRTFLVSFTYYYYFFNLLRLRVKFIFQKFYCGDDFILDNCIVEKLNILLVYGILFIFCFCIKSINYFLSNLSQNEDKNRIL